jgi:hypothetical protein
VDDDYLSVEDRPFDRNIEGFGDDRKTVCPVVTVAGVDPGALIYVDLQPVAVILDLWGGDKPRHLRRHGAFDHPRDEAGLCTLGHYATHKTPV